MKKFIISLLFFSILFFCYHSTNQVLLFANNASDSEIQLVINDRHLEGLLTPPVILNDFTLVPARDVFEELGARVDWDPSTRHIYIEYKEYFILLQIDNSVALLNDAPALMDIFPQIINGRTMIPVRFVAESLGFLVDWDQDLRTVFIDTYYQEQPPTTMPPPDSPPSENGAQPSYQGIVPARDISPAPLVDMDFPQTDVVGITMLSDIRQAIDISTSSEISEVRTSLLPDNRLIIDFHNAEMNTTATEFTPSDTSAYRQIRVAQFQVTPSKITRVVVELQSGVHYSITMSPDRRTLSIDFQRNYISNIAHHSSSVADYITITGTRAVALNVSHFSGPDRFVVDIPFADITQRDLAIYSRFVRLVNASAHNQDTVRIVLELNERASFSVDYSGNSATIRLTEATHRNMFYDNTTGVLRLARGHSALHANSLTITDAYWDRQTIITLPGDFSGMYGFGIFEINDHNMLAFDTQTINGVTRITASSRRILAVTITEDSNYIYITFRHPREVYNRIVVIDPGHGGADPGTTSIGGVHEKYLVLNVSLKLLELFNSSSDVRVYMTRRSDTTVSRPARAALANEVGADLFISVHMNSAAPNQAPRGTETHYHPDADIRGGGFNSAQMAEIFQRHVQGALGTVDRRLVRGAWDVLTMTNMPSILSEIGFLSNPYEAEMLKNPATQMQAAQAMFNATMEIFNNHNLR